MDQHYSVMHHISMLGKLLDDTIKKTLSIDILNKIETIRQLSKSSRTGNPVQRQALLKIIHNLSNNELLPVAKAFHQFLNLANVVEQYDSISLPSQAASNSEVLAHLLVKLQKKSLSKTVIIKGLKDLSLELVLTSHPTEIARRTLINQWIEINNCLVQLDHHLDDYQYNNIMQRLRQLIAQCWHTDEIRKNRPTPIHEAKWGLAVIENSLWNGVPMFLRSFNEQLANHLAINLPIDINFIHFTSWMGGDRDGNEFVTADVTRKVILLSRWKAAELFFQDLKILVSELSMSEATAELRELAGGDHIDEPYRTIAQTLQTSLRHTIYYFECLLKNEELVLPPKDYIYDNKQLWQPLYTCYQSLITCGMSIIANGQLLDTLRRISCFGLQLVRIDIRQESSRHTATLAEVLNYLELGDYQSWSEKKKQNFLLTELSSKRPLVPKHWKPSLATQEVLDTYQVIAHTFTDSIAAYVISMTKVPSDILAVQLLLKESGCSLKLPVVPLFETLDDLNNAETVIQQLLTIPWYRQTINNKLMVMIGYSDSAKDAGVIAASWAQYRAQESLIKLCKQENIKLTLFHGRGGTIGRGGAPAHAALLSQPPGSLQGGLRVTEQGEMIRFKYGLPEVTINSLFIYTSAILEANLLPPPEPKSEWRAIMDILSYISCQKYRDYVCKNPDFWAYFSAATPEGELSKLPLSSRPTKRSNNNGLDSLRAITWSFAWTQNRLMLPAWLGAGAALQHVIDNGLKSVLDEMWHEWPFFKTRIAMLEMVFAKADLWLAEYYDLRLVDKSLWPLGMKLRQQLAQDIQSVLAISQDKTLMADFPGIAESITLRNIYTNPLNLLQVELLYRSRKQHHSNNIEQALIQQALMVTIAGIAAGMRNTG